MTYPFRVDVWPPSVACDGCGERAVLAVGRRGGVTSIGLCRLDDVSSVIGATFPNNSQILPTEVFAKVRIAIDQRIVGSYLPFHH